MPRIRSIKPEFFTDENLCQLSPYHRLAFEGLWCYADKQGRLKDRPGYLKTMILPYDNIDFNGLLNDLSKTNSGRGQPLINRYCVGGDNYIQVSNFAEHQRPHHTEKDSNLPVIPPISNGYKTVKPPIKKVGKEAVLGKGMVIGKEGKGTDSPANAVQGIVDLYNEHCPSLPRVQRVSRTRVQKVSARLREYPEDEPWVDLFKRVEASDFLTGRNGEWTACGFDWILKESNIIKVLEGNYDNRGEQKAMPFDDPRMVKRMKEATSAGRRVS